MDVNTELAYTRTHLANERTFAAWMRTGLSIGAAGFGVAKLSPSAPSLERYAAATGAALLVLGSFTILLGAWSYRKNYRRMCEAGAPPAPVIRTTSYVVAVILAVMLLVVVRLL